MADPEDLNAILAENLRFFMSKPGALYPNPNALGTASGLAPNTIRNYMDPKRRGVVTKKGEGFPTLDKLAKLAKALQCEVWELLHPNIRRSLSEREMYRNIEINYKHLLEASKERNEA